MQIESLESIFLGNRLPLKELTLSVKFYLPLKELMRHLFIYGGKDCGKTILAKIIVEESALKGIPSVIIDLKGDFSSMVLSLNEERLSSQKEEVSFNLDNLKKFGLGEDYLLRLKEKTRIAILTPYFDKGIPLIFPLLPDFSSDTQRFFTNIFSQILIQYLYPEEKEKEEEEKFLSEIVGYVGEKKITFEKREELMEFLEQIQQLSSSFDFSSERRMELIQRLEKFLWEQRKKIMEVGIPLDIDLLRGKYFGEKGYISIISFKDTEPIDRLLGLVQIMYAICNWAKRVNQSLKLIFCIDKIDEILDEKIASLTDFFLKEIEDCGVGCIFTTTQFNNFDYDWIKRCKVWAVGRLEEEKRKRFVEEITRANIEFKDIQTLIDFPHPSEFLLRLPSQEVILLKERWIGSLHRVIESELYSSLIREEIKSDFRAFYISGKEKTSLSTGQVVIPEVIFERFNFGGEMVPFVLEKEPEEAIKLLLEELDRENITPREIQFKNVQLVVAKLCVANWRVDFLHHDALGRITQHIKQEGTYSKVGVATTLDKRAKERMLTLVDKNIHPRWEEIGKKVAIIKPPPVKVNRYEVLTYISEKLGVSVKDAYIKMREQDIAFEWRFLLEYRGKIIEAFVNPLLSEVKVNFPPIKKEEVLEELKREYPDLKVGEGDIKDGLFFYTVEHRDKDQLYVLRISKKSGKILTQKTLLTGEKARQLAKNISREEPFMVKKDKGAWHFYYSSGMLIIVDEETGEITRKEIVSSQEVEDLAYQEILKILKEKEGEFSLVRKEFKEGKWFLNFVSPQWDIKVIIDEEGKIIHTSQLQRIYCLEEAKKILAEEGILVSAERGMNVWKNGWEVNFLSPLGYFTVRIAEGEKELIKRRLTPQGIEHFIKFKLKGEIISLKDKKAFWQVTFKKDGEKYRLRIDKIDSKIRSIRIKKGIFWRKTDKSFSF
ncbi:MAG: hypothetical protein B6D56_01780 [Candidatus Omnitrophica bacterium 4484_70.1]|nr:MAG: hypothetical protein B6D56_01780 [Candidatus Omnitrophica bacterium 4484_70.1]